MAAKTPQPSIFTLMRGLPAEERQRLGERRRALKSGDGIVESLVEEDGLWRLEYRRGKKKISELPLTRRP